jgi:hypothetical protein
MAMYIPMAIMAVGAAVSAVGQIRQGQAANAAAQYNAAVGENNARLAEQQAQSQAMVQERRASMQNGALKANLAANGVDVGEGSAIEILSQSAAAAEMDRQNIVYNGRMKAYSLRNGATLDLFQGNAAEQNGYMSAAGSLLQSAGKMYGMSQGGAGSTISANG